MKSVNQNMYIFFNPLASFLGSSGSPNSCTCSIHYTPIPCKDSSQKLLPATLTPHKPSHWTVVILSFLPSILDCFLRGAGPYSLALTSLAQGPLLWGPESGLTAKARWLPHFSCQQGRSTAAFQGWPLNQEPRCVLWLCFAVSKVTFQEGCISLSHLLPEQLNPVR